MEIKKSYFYELIPVEITMAEKEQVQILEEFPLLLEKTNSNSKDLSDCIDGETVDEWTVLLNQVEEKTTSTNKPYLDLVLSNNKGNFKAKYWDTNGSVYELLEFLSKNKSFIVSGKVDEYPKNSGNKSLTIKDYKESGKEDLYSLLPRSSENAEENILELITYINELEEPHRSLAKKAIKKYWKEFSVKPAAKGHHHAFIGGLLQHKLEMIRIARFIAKEARKTPQKMLFLLENIQIKHREEMIEKLQSKIPGEYRKLIWNDCLDHLYKIVFEFTCKFKEKRFDINVLITSIIFHDIGKIYDYAHAGETNKYELILPFVTDLESYEQRDFSGITMDPLGSLIGHMPYGMLIFYELTKEIPLDLPTFHEYAHNILSHHGKIEWGSSVRPQLPTSYALHFIDYLSARYANV